MNQIDFIVLEYTFSFWKIFFASSIFFHMPYKRRIFLRFLTGILAVAVLSVWVDFLRYSILYHAVSVLLLSFSTKERTKKNTGMVVLSFCGVSTLDVILSIPMISIYGIGFEALKEDILFVARADSITFFLLAVVYGYTLLFQKEKKPALELPGIYILIFIVVCCSISYCLTCIQFIVLKRADFLQANFMVTSISVLGMSILFVFVCVLLAFKKHENGFLKKEADLNQNLLKIQEDYYQMLLQKEEETRAFRHDLREHLYCLRVLFHDGDREKLGSYLLELEAMADGLSPALSTGNTIVTAVAANLSARYPDVCLQWNGKLPGGLAVSQADLCTLFYNLLHNAFEAAQSCGKKEVWVDIKALGANIWISIRNPSVQGPLYQDGKMVSGKQETGHGYGIYNVCRCVERNHGDYKAAYEDGIFQTEIILPDAVNSSGFD